MLIPARVLANFCKYKCKDNDRDLQSRSFNYLLWRTAVQNRHVNCVLYCAILNFSLRRLYNVSETLKNHCARFADSILICCIGIFQLKLRDDTPFFMIFLKLISIIKLRGAMTVCHLCAYIICGKFITRWQPRKEYWLYIAYKFLNIPGLLWRLTIWLYFVTRRISNKIHHTV